MQSLTLENIMIYTEWLLYGNPTYKDEIVEKFIETFGDFDEDRFNTCCEAITEKYNAVYYAVKFNINNNRYEFIKKDIRTIFN